MAEASYPRKGAVRMRAPQHTLVDPRNVSSSESYFTLTI